MSSTNSSFPSSTRNLQVEYEQLKEQHLRRGLPVGSPPDSVVSPHHTSEDSELIAEAKLLRQHKGRLEARMQILEDHNKQLESQLHRLRQLLEQVECAEPGIPTPSAPVPRSMGLSPRVSRKIHFWFLLSTVDFNWLRNPSTNISIKSSLAPKKKKNAFSQLKMELLILL